MRTLTCLAALTLLAARVSAETPRASEPASAAPVAKVHRFELDNGLRVLVEPVEGTERALLLVAYARGARDDPRGYRGLTHLTEHLSFRRGQVLADYDDLGVTGMNGLTYADETVYYARIPLASLERAMWIEARRMAFMLEDLREEDVAHERKIVIHEWREHSHGVIVRWPKSVLSALYPQGHPYLQVGDDPEHVDDMRLRDVRWYAQDVYQPANATVVAKGAVDPHEVRRWAVRYFGGIKPARATKTRVTAAPLEPLSRQCRVRSAQKAVDDTVRFSWIAPARYSEDDARLEVVTALLKRPKSAFSRLTDVAGPAFETEVTRDSRALASTLDMSVAALPDANIDEIIATVDAAIRGLSQGEFSEDELQAAAKHAANARLAAARNWFEHALELATSDETDLVARDLKLYREMSKSDVQRVAEHWLDPRRRVILRYDREGRSRDRMQCEAIEATR